MERISTKQAVVLFFLSIICSSNIDFFNVWYISKLQYQHKILLTSDERKNVRKMHYTQVYYLYKNKKYTQNLWKYYAFYGVKVYNRKK